MTGEQLATITSEMDVVASQLQFMVDASPKICGFGPGMVIADGEALKHLSSVLKDRSIELRKLLRKAVVTTEGDE